MKIIIVGCGNVGSTIAKQLSQEGHDITIVDKDEKSVRSISDNWDVMGIVGSGASLSILRDAGVTEADMLIAVTDSDERNLFCCLMAKKAGARHTIARVRNPEFKEDISYIKEDLGLSMAVNPEQGAADEIARLLKFPSAIEIDSFARGRVDLLKFEVTKDSPINGMVLKDMHKTLNTNVLICIVERENETIIPTGDFVMKEGDRISFVASTKRATQFFKAMNLNQGKARSCMIVGGGETTYYLAKQLISTGVEVKIVDKVKAKCDELAAKLPEAVIINGDGQDKNLLSEEGIERTQSFVTLTNHDEINVMMSIYAKKANPKVKLITKVHRSTYDDIIDDMNIGSIINPKLIAGESVIQYVRALQNSMGSNMESLYKLCSGKAEAIEFKVKESSKLTGVPLKDIKLKPNVIICCIIHNGVIETPGGLSTISLGDTVIVVTTNTGFDDITDILD